MGTGIARGGAGRRRDHLCLPTEQEGESQEHSIQLKKSVMDPEERIHKGQREQTLRHGVAPTMPPAQRSGVSSRRGKHESRRRRRRRHHR